MSIDVQEITKKLSRVDKSGSELDVIVNSIVTQYCKELDDFISKIYSMISDKNIDVPDVDIEYMVLQLPCLMYFLSGKMEDLGLREDVAKGIEKEKYNEILFSAEGKVSEKEGAAQNGSKEEYIVSAICSRAYRKLKARLDYASATLESLKKVLTNRISDKELTRKDVKV